MNQGVPYDMDHINMHGCDYLSIRSYFISSKEAK